MRIGFFEYGVACAEAMLGATEPPTAIFASNDDTAVIAVAQKRCLRLPDQLSVAGFDDAPVASMILADHRAFAAPARLAGPDAARAARFRAGYPQFYRAAPALTRGRNQRAGATRRI